MMIRARTLKKRSDPSTTTCADGHRCDNHSECVENPNDESQYFCDCDASALLWDEAFAGLSCEHKATTYCKHDQFFCTNGSDCERQHASDGTKYTECDCADGYEGSHCQFVAGSAPQNWPNDAASTVITSRHHGGGGVSTGGIVAIVVVVLALASVGAFFGWRYMTMKKETRGVLDDFADMAADSMTGKKGNSSSKEGVSKKTKTKKESSTELKLDADGGKLKDAMDDIFLENEEPLKEMI